MRVALTAPNAPNTDTAAPNGVAPEGLDLGSAQPLPQLILGPLRDFTCLVKCLRGLVRATVPAPNAPNANVLQKLRKKEMMWKMFEY